MKILHLASILLLPLLLAFQAGAARAMDGDGELLPEDEAFAFSASLLPDNTLEVRWEIAEGYYMYRDKMGFEVAGDNALAGPVELPPGKPKHDELFGDVDVYLGEFVMRLPLRDAGARFTLLAMGQGCNEPVGVCYPPMQHEIEFRPGTANISGGGQPPPQGIAPALDGLIDLSRNQPQADTMMQSAANDIPAEDSVAGATTEPAMDETLDPVAELKGLLQADPVVESDPASPAQSIVADAGEEADSVAALRNLLEGGFEQPEFLPPEEAFKVSVSVIDSNTLEARFDVVEGYYLYQDKLSFTGRGDARIGDFRLPDGEEKNDEFFGLTRVYKHPFTVPIDLQRTGPDAGTLTVEAGYQGCAEQGICYPPTSTEFTLALPAMIAEAAAAEETATVPGSGGETPIRLPGSDADIGSGSLLSILAGALLAGLLLAFTPCVLPMIPILSGVIAGQGDNLTRMRGGLLALIYVIGTAVTYAIMGWVAGATGEQLQAYFQNAWAIGILSAIFVLMALSMFGLYEIQMPSAIQSRLQNSTSGMSGSAPLVFILGLVSALIVGACVSPILISFLGIAVSRADPVLGAQMMFVMALGMGVPLIALGFGAGYLLPRAGAWMDMVKHFFGVLLIAVAIYLLGVLPAVPILLLWGVFFIIISTYLGATQSLPEGSSGWRRLAKGVGMVLLVWGIAALIGGFHGSRDLLKPLPSTLFAGGGASSAPAAEVHLFTPVNNTGDLDRQFELARASGKRIVLDYYADWCVDCVKMEKTTFQDPAVAAVLRERYLPLQVDVTDPKDPGPKAVKKRFGVFGPPAVLFFDVDGNPMADMNFYGYRSPGDFLALIEPR